MRLAFFRQRLRTRQPFATFHGVTSEKETIVVELKYDGLIGLGRSCRRLCTGNRWSLPKRLFPGWKRCWKGNRWRWKRWFDVC
jgi:hypothetical protein